MSSLAGLATPTKGLWQREIDKKQSFFVRLNYQGIFGRLSQMSEDKKKTKLFGESMEMLGENLVESNAKLGDEAKNDELGQAAADAMRALLKNKEADAED